MLKSQFPTIKGLQDTILAERLATDPTPGEFVQVLLVGGDHWIAVSTLGSRPGHITVYSSLHYRLSSRTKRVIADLMQSTSCRIMIMYANVQHQSGGSDCGLFALAFCCTLCNGQDPTHISYTQSEMRSHLHTCLLSRRMTPFPEQSRVRRVKTLSSMDKSEELPIFCVCQLPDDGKKMIQCKKCSKWYHCGCITVRPKYIDNCKMDWNCGHCEK